MATMRHLDQVQRTAKGFILRNGDYFCGFSAVIRTNLMSPIRYPEDMSGITKAPCIAKFTVSEDLGIRGLSIKFALTTQNVFNRHVTHGITLQLEAEFGDKCCEGASGGAKIPEMNAPQKRTSGIPLL